MSRRKKIKHDEGISESWLLPYADLLTLLLALFIVLFSSSAVDAQKFERLSQVFNGIFMGGNGLINYQNPTENDDNWIDNPESSQYDDEEGYDRQVLDAIDQQELTEIQAKINAYIEKNEFHNKFDTSLTEEGLLLTIRDNVLFQSGRADVRSADKKTAGELAVLLEVDPPRNIIISGHTDNIPIRNANFQSNWDLSVMRAVNFVKILLENENLDPRWFSARGYGEFQPIGDNNTAEGRAKNRRVEVLILPRVQR